MDFRIFVLWLHLLAVVVWVGGAFFWMLVLLTKGRSREHDEGDRWVEKLGRRFYVIGWEALGLIVLTGLFNLISRMRAGTLFQPDFTESLLLKLSLMVGMAGIQGWLHLGVMAQLAVPDGAPFDEWRKKMLAGSVAFLVLGAGALWIGVRLRYV